MFDKFNICKDEVENQLEKKIKILSSNRGGEYIPNEMKHFCEVYGIIQQFTLSHAPQSNGVTKKKICTLPVMVNATLISFGLLNNL